MVIKKTGMELKTKYCSSPSHGLGDIVILDCDRAAYLLSHISLLHIYFLKLANH